MKAGLIRFATERPRTVYALIGALVLLTAALIPNIQIDTDPENMLPADDPARVFHNQVKSDFALYDSIVVGAVAEQGIFNPDSLASLHQLTNAILKLDGVVQADLMALSTSDNITQESPGTIRFEYLMREAPQTQAASDAIGDAVARLPMLDNTLVSGDGKAAAIYVPLQDKDDSYAVAERIRALIAEQAPKDTYYLTGLPVAENQFGHEMFVQMAISAPLAGAMIFALMWFFFRSLPLVVAPMLVAMATVIATMGTLIGMGYTVHIMSSMIAIFLMPIAVVDSVHIMSDFTDRYRAGKDPKAVIREVMGDLFNPMLFTSVTSAVGFYSLMLTPIPPVQIFGAFVGSGILLAFLVSILLVPAYVVRMKPATLDAMQARLHGQGQGGLLARILPKVGRGGVRLAKPIVVVAIAALAFSAVGIGKIQINDNPVRWFKADHEIRVADKALNHHFAGTYDAYLVLTDTRALATDAEAQALGAQLATALPGDNQAASLLQAGLAGDTQQLATLLSRLDDAAFDAQEATQLAAIDTAMATLEALAERSRRFLDPAVLSWITGLQEDLEASGLVGKSNALTDIVQTVNRELHSGEDADFRLPDSAAGVAQTLLQFQSSHRPQDLWHFVTRDYRQSLLWLQLTSGDNQHMNLVIDRVDAYLAAHPLPADLKADWAGKAYINVIWQDAMVSGMLESLLSAFVVIFIMMSLLFRSPLYGLVAMLPLSLTIAFIYGLVGWLGKDYDMPIAVLSALALGLSVDFAIHFLERTRALHRQTGDVRQTLALMFEEPARAISRNAIVIALGFTPLLLAPLVPYITVGVLMASIMAVSATVTLLLLPAALTLLARWALPARPNAHQGGSHAEVRA
ncbi:efflux RND transporter permease subunit [Ferrimonas balearica]|uniref:efflux RND transporter permease subunit n=1 Tax=Ferrimonas balearica TaxID=44012 RepID=UPI001C999063|nr:MMPL family transporter [Ferrimonas balearica]MBY5992952.1 MMPL family transporter [Ferrimonas balearica]